jgi:hypothetical protein
LSLTRKYSWILMDTGSTRKYSSWKSSCSCERRNGWPRTLGLTLFLF